MRSKILITGGSGFVGQGLITSGYFDDAIYLSRKVIPGVVNLVLSELSQNVDYSKILKDIDIVIHCAGVAHNLEQSKSIESSFNVKFTRHFANQAAKCGVKQFILISTAKVFGEENECSKPFNAKSKIAPKSFYAKSKALAEECLISEANKSYMSYTIIRPPLIYGIMPKGNLKTLSTLIKLKIPLPVAGVYNCRNMISLEDLIRFVYVCSKNNQSWDKKFLIGDGIDYSTKDLVELIAKNLNLNVRTYWLPPKFLKVIFQVIGKSRLYSSVYGSFKLELTCQKDLLGWEPRRSLASFANKE